jgi:hypothetical protein
MNEFVFGSLSSQIGRLVRYKERKNGLWHDQRTEPLAPQAGDVRVDPPGLS